MRLTELMDGDRAIFLPPAGGDAEIAGLTSDSRAVRPGFLFAALAGARTQYAVNQTIVRDPSHPISDQDEIAFLPPMSGG